MRLIDVDKLEADVEYWENHDDPKKPDYDARDIEQVIGFQPIVEAIPIEWIADYLQKIADDDDEMPQTASIGNMLMVWLMLKLDTKEGKENAID